MERRFRNTPKRTRAMLWPEQSSAERQWTNLVLMLISYTGFAALVMWSLYQ